MEGNAHDQRPETWSAGAEGYDASFAPFTFPYSAEALRLLEVGPGCRLLDVAAGSGAVTLQALALGADVLATDFSPGMVELLSRRVVEAGYPDTAVELMDGQALTLDDATFDVAVSMLGLFFFPDIDAGVRELARVVRPGGQVATGVWNLDRFSLVSLVRRAVAIAAPEVEVPGGVPTWARIGHPAGLEELFAAHGLHDIEVHEVPQWWQFDDPVQFFLDLPSWSPPVQPLFEALGPEVIGRVATAFVDVVAEASDPEGLRADVLVAIGRR